MTLPIRLRLTLWYAALLAVALVAFSAAVYGLMARALDANLDAALRQRVQQVDVDARVVRGHLALTHHRERTDATAAPAALLSPSGHVIEGTMPPSLRAWITDHHLALAPGLHLLSEGGLRIAVESVGPRSRPAGYVAVWQSTAAIASARHSLFGITFALGPAVLVIAVLGGLVLSRRALRPVVAVTHAAAAVAAGDLAERVPVSPARDEMRDLARMFNAMIDRLEAAMERERRFTADASHELRAPLSVIRAEATLALERSRTADEYRSALRIVDEEAASMEELLAALLAVARKESAADQHEVSTLLDLVQAAVMQAKEVTRAGNVVVKYAVPPHLTIRGSPALLTRAIRNIVENALRQSRPGDTVTIYAERARGDVELIVQDEGPGIPLAERERVFEPFYQLGSARTPGETHGLGLTICRNIVQAHGGDVVILPDDGRGARFRIVLPAA